VTVPAYRYGAAGTLEPVAWTGPVYTVDVPGSYDGWHTYHRHEIDVAGAPVALYLRAGEPMHQAYLNDLTRLLGRSG
jgi:hypothetical protein